ncbi:MAG: hypothetical protein NZ959_07900 [Armatimonadetes bacterium]|nr:hypothetical protein [Armatimonadota bacterium]MDW8121924.1 CARDB domain-containing protein [Armatimonadota bacterium]
MRGWMGLLIGFLCLTALGLIQPFEEDFSRYPNGSEGEPDWQLTQIGFEVRDGRFVFSGRTQRVYAVWVKVPPARRMTLTARVTLRRALNADWKIAGIGVFQDPSNYWHLALVEAPEREGRRRFFELAEMMDGVWLAHGGPDPLTTVEEWTTAQWEYDTPYTLRIVLDPDRIMGEVRAPDGMTLYRCIRLLDKKAVTWGRPMLDGYGFVAEFDDVTARVVSTVTEQEVVGKTYPPFQWKRLAGAPKKVKGTGFFSVRLIQGIWWLIDPSGTPTLSIGTDHCNYYVHWCEKLGYAPYHRVVSKKYGSEEKWAEEAVRRLLSWNFNVLGANNSVKARYKGLAHTEFISFGAAFADQSDIVPKVHWTGFPDVFDPLFEKFCDRLSKERCAPHRDDPWLLGYFLDNELEWWGKSGRPWGIAEEAWKKTPDRPCKKALLATLKRFYNNRLSSLNRDFNTTFQEWNDVLQSQTPPTPQTERGRKALMEFVAEAAERYFRITSQAIKRYDPNHLNLGCRFAWDAPEPAWIAAGKYCDIVTLNMYPRADLEKNIVVGVTDHLKRVYSLCQRPIIVTEWSFPALDAVDSEGRPLPSRHGAGMRVDSQTQKARCYALFQKTIFPLPFIVGSHYFMWVDEPALGISSTFPEDSNYGLVSESDEPYRELTEMATIINSQLGLLHSGAVADLSVQVSKSVLTVSNKGQRDAQFVLRLWINGRPTETTRRLKAGHTTPIAIPSPSASPEEALYVYAQVDPNDEIPEGDESNNSADLVLPPRHKPADLPIPGTRLIVPAAIVNPTGTKLVNVPVTFPIPASFPPKKPISAWIRDQNRWTALPCQANWSEKTVTVLLPSIAPYQSQTLWLATAPLPKEQGSPILLQQISDQGMFVLDNGVLRLIKEESDGDAFDRIFFKVNGTEKELGRLHPLLWQVLLGQNLWVPPDKVEKIEVVEKGPARLVLEMTFSRNASGKDVITEVGPGGVLAPLQATPQPFRCAFRFTFWSSQPFFLSQLLWLENTGSRPYEVPAYYHYLPSRIGGSDADDQVGGPQVPNYWLRVVTWFDEAERIHFGVFPVEEDERVGLTFWKDEGGRQHPDCSVRVGTVLSPGQRWSHKPAEPTIVVFGARETPQDKRPWSSLYHQVRASLKVRAVVFE